MPARPPAPDRIPNVHPACRNVPGINDDGFEELCHLVTAEDPDTALCGKDVTGYPVEPAVAALRGVPGGGPRRAELSLDPPILGSTPDGRR